MDVVLYLQIPPDCDKAGDGANKNADTKQNREYLAEVIYVRSEQAHPAENGSDLRIHPNDNRVENNHRYQSREKSVHHAFHYKRPAGETVAGADQPHHFYLVAGRIDGQADSVECHQNGNQRQNKADNQAQFFGRIKDIGKPIYYFFVLEIIDFVYDG